MQDFFLLGLQSQATAESWKSKRHSKVESEVRHAGPATAPLFIEIRDVTKTAGA